MVSYNIILIAAEPWEHYTWRRRHHVAWNLAKNNRVLFVEPPLTLFQPLREVNLNWRHLLNLGRFKYQGRNLYSYSPVRLLPLSLPGAKRFNYYERDKKRTFNRLKNIVRSLKYKDPILWVYYRGYQYEYYGLFDERIVIGDCYDKFSAPVSYRVSNEWKSRTHEKESILIKNSDIVFAVSKELYDDLIDVNKNTFLIPNGVDFEAFLKPSKPTKKQSTLQSINKPVLGYLGIMHYKVDFELLEFIARAHPEWSIVLMGMYWIKETADRALFDSLIKKDNVKYLGKIAKIEIPSYLEYIDVCLLPWKKIEFNRYANPLKLLEYFAAGKPVVAVDQGGKNYLSEFVKVADTKEAYIEAIADALEEERQNGESLAEARKNIARENSWGGRVNQMMEIIESHLNS